MQNTNIKYALNSEGKLVYIDDVPNGLECNCFCPACKGRMIARQGDINEHGFAHYDLKECKNGFQTTIHLLAKEIIKEEKSILLPVKQYKGMIYNPENGYDENDWYYSEYRYFLGDRFELGIYEKTQYNKVLLDDVILEKKIDNIIPDIIGIAKNRKLLIEIYVTHKIDEAKAEKIKEKGFSCIEIDLSKVDKGITKEELKKEIYTTKNIKPIYNVLDETHFNKAVADFRKQNIQIEKVLTNLYWSCWGCYNRLPDCDDYTTKPYRVGKEAYELQYKNIKRGFCHNCMLKIKKALSFEDADYNKTFCRTL